MPVKTPTITPSLSGLSELTKRLEDLSPLPASREVERWLVATQVTGKVHHKYSYCYPQPQGNVEAAEYIYRSSATWRRQKGVDRLVKWKPPVVLRKYYPGGFAGFDRAGCPVWIIPFGQADMKGW